MATHKCSENRVEIDVTKRENQLINFLKRGHHDPPLFQRNVEKADLYVRSTFGS